MVDVEIKLSAEPDALGFHYGGACWGDAYVRLDVIPPRPLFRAHFAMDHPKPHSKHWRVFADGEEIARIDATPQNLIAALERLLVHGETP